MFDELRRDVAFGSRLLLRQPGFTLVAVLTLALGIGATTSIFAILNGVLFKPLPFPEPEQLLFIGQSNQGIGPAGTGEPKFLFWNEHSQSFDAMACYSGYGGARGNLSGGRESEYARGLRVSAGFFSVFGVTPAIGRSFNAGDDTLGSERVAILSDELWKRQFGGNAGVIGQVISFNGQPVTIVGVLPAHFRFGTPIDLLIPMQARVGANVDPNAEVVGRLKRGITIDQARSEMALIAEKFRAGLPQQMREQEGIALKPYREMLTDADTKRYLWMLAGAVTFLLLIACLNVANLQLARVASRQREIAVRRALGASAMRIARQLLTEGFLLALIGGITGTLLAFWAKDVMMAALPPDLLPRLTSEASVDWRVLLCALGASAVTGILFGLAPIWQAKRIEVYGTLKDAGPRASSGATRLRGMLVVAEVALSLVLLVGAGLLARTFLKLMSVETGFDPHNVLTFQVVLDGPRYDTTQEAAAFYDQSADQIRSIAGVESVGVTNKLPLDWQFNMPVTLSTAPDKIQALQVRMVTADYFRSMRIALRQGRLFNANDNSGAAPVAIVNEAFVRKVLAGGDPFSTQLTIGRRTSDLERQIIGVVADVKQMGLDRPALPTVFAPIPQISDRLLSVFRTFTPAYFTVRATTSHPRSLVEPIKREIAKINPGLAISELATMEEITARSVSQQRFYMWLLGLFACLGMVLAGIGIYGVMSYSVAQRGQELGIRIALGATPRDLMALIVRQSLVLALIGIVLGAGASLALTRLMKGFLFEVSPVDPLTFVGVSVLLLVIALVAAAVPARKATAVDPLVALKAD
jgi:putative ABC transport system permease protein